MAGVFISYRREDSGGYAGRLSDHLQEHFGKEQVFMDVDRIQPGEDFKQAIEKTVASSDALVAVIGKKWLTIKNKKGQRRLEDPEDYVRLEIVEALGRGIPVIPVLVGGAQMPSPGSLPDILQKLAGRQAHSILDIGFKQSVSSLINTIERQSKREQEAARKVPTKVLWVDDNPANNQALIDRYRSRGIIFDLALNTKQALDFLAQGEYALIISDIGRGSDWKAGIDMIPQIRSRFPKAPPIIINAHTKAVEAHAEEAKKLGASLVTAKPEELIDWLEKVPV